MNQYVANATWQLTAMVIILALLAVGLSLLSPPTEQHQGQDDPLSQVRFYYIQCINAHYEVGGSHWESIEQHYVGLREYDIRYRVILVRSPTAPLVNLSIDVERVFPDASSLSCVFDSEQRVPISGALWGEGLTEVKFDAYELFDLSQLREDVDSSSITLEKYRYELSRVVRTYPNDRFAMLVL